MAAAAAGCASWSVPAYAGGGGVCNLDTLVAVVDRVKDSIAPRFRTTSLAVSRGGRS